MSVEATSAPAGRRHRRRPRLSVLLVLAVGAFAVLAAVNPDVVTDVAWHRPPDPDLRFAARWLFAAPVLVCALLHYCCAAVALQASAGARLPMRPRVLAGLSAATANRLTPAGLGGAAVNARFLVRAGGLSSGEAAAAVLALATLGAAADLALFATLAAVSAVAGVTLPRAQVSAVQAHALSLLHTVGYAGAAAALVATAAAAVIVLRRRAGRAATRAENRPSWLRRASEVAAHASALVRRPRAVLLLMTSSAGTTLMMGLALLCAVEAVSPSPLPVAPVLIVLAYMVGSAAGNAAGVPSVVGLTEAGLVGGLVLLGIPVGRAVTAVVLFRVVTFWMPAVAGLPAARALRSRGWL